MLQFLIYLVPLVGLGALGIGLAAMVMPAKMSGIFGVAVDGKAVAFVIGMGVRDLFIGGAITLLYFLELLIPAGWLLLMLGAVSFSDFVVVRKWGSKLISLTHLTGAVVVTCLSLFIIWFLP
jgi:hypothetical protein